MTQKNSDQKKTISDQHSKAILDMTLSLMENTFDDNHTTHDKDLLAFSTSLNRFLSRNKRSTHRIKELERAIHADKKNYEEEIAALKETKTSEIKSLYAEIEAYQSQIASLRNENNRLEQEEGLTDASASLRKQFKDVKALHNDIEGRLESITSYNSRLEEAKRKELSKLETIMESAARLKDKNARESEKVSLLSDEIRGILESNKEVEAEIDRLKEEIKGVEVLLSDPAMGEKDKLNSLFKEKKERYQREKADLDQKLREKIRKKGEKLHAKQKDSQKALLEKEVKEFKEKNKELYEVKERLNDIEGARRRGEAALEKQRERLEGLREKLQEKRKEITEDEGQAVYTQLMQLRTIEDRLEKKIEEKELELRKVGENTLNYRVYLNRLIEVLKEEEGEMEKEEADELAEEVELESGVE